MSSNVTVTTHGERELAIRFERFPEELRERLAARIDGFTAELLARVEGKTPVLTGALQGEEGERTYNDRPGRIAGYVGVYAAGAADPTNAYAKAATIEYGTDKPRRAFERKGTLAQMLTGNRRRIVEKLSRQVHIEPARYLRDPIQDMQPEVLAGIAEELAQVTAEANA